MNIKILQLYQTTTARDGTIVVSLWTLLLMSHKVLQHHLDFTSLVTELATVLDLFDESSDHTVGHVGWHGLAAGRTVSHFLLTRFAHDMSGGADGNRKVSGNVETHGAL